MSNGPGFFDSDEFSIVKDSYKEKLSNTHSAAPVPPQLRAEAAPPVKTVAPKPVAPATPDAPAKEFIPVRPSSLAEAGLNPEYVAQLIGKYLYPRGASTGRKMSEHFGLPFKLLEPLLSQMKNEMTLAYKNATAMGDYEYVLTDQGHERARRDIAMCAYAESAPVPIADYIASVGAQSLTNQRISVQQLKEAFSDLLIDPKMLDRLGPAINSGKGMFLYGNPGNGKTSIAERITRCFGSNIWIPRAIDADGEIVNLFDPVIHEPADQNEGTDGVEADQRWIRIVRPTVVVGGELTMDQLEVQHNSETNVSEAPLQMKSNCGALVIDDFGRQRMPTTELLNRWIIPLEKRYDFQNLAGGKKIQVPFDQLVVFSTNLEPKDLVDEAFLRRIPYKIEIMNPTEEIFVEICRRVAPAMGFPWNEDAIQYMIRKHYTEADRSMRSCHPRDLLLQVRSHCLYHGEPLQLSEESIDKAAENYFTVM